MHESGLHSYDPEDEFFFANTVIGNKKSYSKWQIKAAEQAREMYASIGYPQVKDYKWVIQSNQIMDFPVTVQDIAVSHKILGKSVPALKGNNTSNKPIPVEVDL